MKSYQPTFNKNIQQRRDITKMNKTLIDTATEILGKHREKKKN